MSSRSQYGWSTVSRSGSGSPVSAAGVGEVRERRVLGHRVGDVDAEPVDAAVEPEPQDVVERLGDLRTCPVEVRLLGREEVQVPRRLLPVAVGGQPLPGRPAEDGPPVVRGVGTAGPVAGAEPVPVALDRAGAGREGPPKPRMLVRGVVGDQVQDDPQAEAMDLGDEGLRLGEIAEEGGDVAVVGDVVAAVGERRRIPGRDPDRVDAEVGQVGESRPDALDVPDAVAVAVGEAADVDLVDDGVPPPLGGRGPVGPVLPGASFAFCGHG